MSFVVETGSGKANATTYVTVETADAYLLDIGHHLLGDTSVWFESTEDDREGALIVATEWLDETFQYVGDKYTKAQALQWPRSGASEDGFAIEVDELPINLEKAAAVAGLEHLKLRGQGGLQVSRSSTGTLSDRTIKIGTLTIAKNFSTPEVQKRIIPKCAQLLRGLTMRNNSLERA